MSKSKGSGTGPRVESRDSPLNDPEQYQRFLEAARELGCDENAERMDEVVRRAAKLPPHRQEASAGRRRKKDPA